MRRRRRGKKRSAYYKLAVIVAEIVDLMAPIYNSDRIRVLKAVRGLLGMDDA